jgi:hypothetical protein
MRDHSSKILLAAAMVATLAACSPQARVVGGGAGPTLGAPVRLAVGTTKADLSVVGDATRILKEAASDSFEAAGIPCKTGACATVDLHAGIAPASSSFAAASPALRVVQLVAKFRPAGAAQAVSTTSYQRTVAVPGNLSTATWMRIADALTTDLAEDFAFRSRKSGIVVRLPSWAATPTALARASAPKAFHVVTTSDGRSDDDIVGVVGQREVRMARRATDYIAEMLADDLRGAGHLLVPAKDGRTVGSELEKFWIEAKSSGGGWETRAEVEVEFEVGPPPGVKRKKPERHSCTASERTMSQPGEPDLARVLQKCLGDLMRSIRSDSAWSLGQSPG